MLKKGLKAVADAFHDQIASSRLRGICILSDLSKVTKEQTVKKHQIQYPETKNQFNNSIC